MDLWRKVWREGLAPSLGAKGLTALRDALARDDPALVQSHTVLPLPVGLKNMLEPVVGACAVAFCCWKEHADRDRPRAAEVDAEFMEACNRAEYRMRQSKIGVAAFLAWFDGTERGEMRRLLLEEVELALKGGEDERGQTGRVHDGA